MKTSIEMVRNWTKDMGTTLSDAMHASMDVGGRSVAEACKQAIILMAMAARKLAKQARPRRRHGTDKHGRWVEVWRGNGDVTRRYSWMFRNEISAENYARRVRWGKPVYRGTLEDAIPIKGRGLAKRSWMWGLAGLPGNIKSGTDSRPPIRGVATLGRILTPKVGGFVLTNRLGYIEKAMPAGWKQMAERSAINRIMGTLRAKAQRMHERAIAAVNAGGRPAGPGAGDMGRYIREAA